MNKIITYFYLEDEKTVSKYGVQEENYLKKNEYYFRCIVNFFLSSLKYNYDCEHYFIINNSNELNFIRNFNLYDFLKRNNIKLIEKRSKYVKPQAKWAGSMYLFDAIEYFLEDDQIDSEDKYIFFDNDMFFNSNLQESLNKIGEFDYLLYDVSHEFINNKKWVVDFNGLDVNKFNEDFKPCGGEFIAIKGKVMNEFINLFSKINCDNKYNFKTEEHYISYMVSYELKKKNIKYANSILKRCWTTLNFNNIDKDDYKKDILHIPSEKEFGIYWYNNKVNSVDKYNSYDIMRYCGILERPLYLKMQLIMKKFKRKMFKQINKVS